MKVAAFWGFLRVRELTNGSIGIPDVSFNVIIMEVTQVVVTLHEYKHKREGTPFNVVMDMASYLTICLVHLLLSYLSYTWIVVVDRAPSLISIQFCLILG